MMAYSLAQLTASLGATSPAFPEHYLERTVTGVKTDSREVGGGDVFFGIRGERFDGASFTPDVLARGALCAVVSRDSYRPEYATMPVIPVPDAVRALGDAAHGYRRRFDGPVVAVTGSSGKTTAREMIRTVLGSSMNVHATAGNLNNHIGLPLSVFGLEKNHDAAVFELGMSAPNEIARLAAITEPDIGVILNVGPAHLAFFDSIEDIADAKMELLDALDSDGTAVVNADDPLLTGAAGRCGCRFVGFGVEKKCAFRAENIRMDKNGCPAFEMHGYTVTLPVPGRHSVYNASAAIAVGSLLGVEVKEAADALSRFTAPAMRMRIETHGGVIVINDSYNANPLSMRSAAEVLAAKEVPAGGRRIAAIGDMLELGERSAVAHRKLGEFFATRADMIVAVGAFASECAAGALEAGMDADRVMTFEGSGEAGEFVKDTVHEGDLLLVKGSRGIKMEAVIAALDRIR